MHLLINLDLLSLILSNLSIQYKNFHWANTTKTSPIRVHGTQRIWFIFSTILFEYTQEESRHNTVKVFGGYLSRSFLTNRSEKVCVHFHVTFCFCLLFGMTCSFQLSESSFRFVDKSLGKFIRIFSILAPILVRPITARSESTRRFDNRKEKSREMSVVG
jgi:hypothetical protein